MQRVTVDISRKLSVIYMNHILEDKYFSFLTLLSLGVCHSNVLIYRDSNL